MANKKITQLQLRANVTDDLNFPSDDAIQSYRVTGQQIKDYVLPDLGVGASKAAAQFIQGQTTATGAMADYLAIADTSDSGNIKKALITDFMPRSAVTVEDANGYGSTATKIRRFSNIRKNIGTAITYADSSANGASFTINENGVYSFSYNDYSNSGGSGYYGMSVDASSLTTNFNALTYAQGRRNGANTSSAALLQGVTWTDYLTAGTVVRPHSDGTLNATVFSMIMAVQVSR